MKTCARTTRTLVGLAVGAWLLASVGCARTATPPDGPRPPVDEGTVSEEVRLGFDGALEEMVRHDRASDWSEEVCKRVASMFEQAAKAHEEASKGPLATARFNAGLAYQRCGLSVQAETQFEAAKRAAPDLHRAEVQLAMLTYRKVGDAQLDSTIQRVEQAVVRAKFQDVDALVNLAMLQMKRGGPHAGAGCENDMSCAKLNLQRALAIDDGYMPAFNQLALLYLTKAKRRAGEGVGTRRHLRAVGPREKEVSTQMLDLAALVCSQAVRRNPRYAPVHNTLGLIQVELGDTNGAVQSFHKARELDPRFFEAHMNYAAVNLSFRGFRQAESAYRISLQLEPNDYEARLGLALALRGQMDASNVDEQIGKVRAQLDLAKRIDEERPETYFNEAILIQEFEAKFAPTDKEKVAAYERAIRVFDTFVSKAASDSRFEHAVQSAKERVDDMRKIIIFLSQPA